MATEEMPNISTHDRGHGRAILTIVLAWASFLALLALLGALGMGTGLTVWPQGEDRNWMVLLDQPTPSGTARGLWLIDHRNPLSPWWYIMGKKFIFGYSHGLFLLRQLVGLMVALSGYWVIVQWLGPQSRHLATVIGCLVAVCVFNAYFDQIHWNFIGALACSLFCIGCYQTHLRCPTEGQWLAAALVLWLVAISTYTIQAGAIFAVGFATWYFGRPGRSQPPAPPDQPALWHPARLVPAARATWPFAAILIVFILVWQTTSIPSDPFFAAPDPARLLASLRMGVWHDDLTLMFRVLERSPHRYLYVGVGVGIFILVALMLRRAALPRLRWKPLLVIALVGCIALPTVFVETVGALWPPGTRWRMLYQFSTPALYISCLAMIAGMLGERSGRLLWRGGVSLCFAAVIVASLAHNERQMDITRDERALRRAILSDSVKFGDFRSHLQYLVLLDGKTSWLSSDYLSPTYARSWFGPTGPSFRLVPSSVYAATQTGPAVAFMADELGVANATVKGATLPYSRIRVVLANDGSFKVLDRLSKEDVEGFRAVWQRDAPIMLAPCPAEGNRQFATCH